MIELRQTIVARRGDNLGPRPGRNMGYIHKAPKGGFVVCHPEVVPYGKRCI
jgi:hypothetical protein